MKVHLAGNVTGHVGVPIWLEEHTETIDRMRIHFADNPFASLRNGCAFRIGHPYYLGSYWYIRTSERDQSEAVRMAPSNMIVDSGLFSLMFGSEKGTIPSTLEAYEAYTEKYVTDLETWGYQGFLVEADVHKLLGMEAVHHLRKRFEGFGDRVIYVWHREEGIEGLLKLAEERSYIAISVPEIRAIVNGGSVAGNSTEVVSRVFDLLRRIHEHCKRRGILPPRIHLLGCTVRSMMETSLAWSCDSTSWLSGIRYGNGFVWDPQGEFSAQPVRSKLYRAWRAECERMFPSSAEFARSTSNPDYYLNVMASAAAFREYQFWLDARYQHVPMRGDENHR